MVNPVVVVLACVGAVALLFLFMCGVVAAVYFKKLVSAFKQAKTYLAYYKVLQRPRG